MMSARPETRPGRWKTVANRVGSRYFVSPEEVGGTLTEAFGVIDDLDDPYSRALLTHYVVTAVHPFSDGNGRSARLMMNAELEHAGYPRIVIPTSWQDNYLSGLHAFEVQGNTGAMLRSMDYAYDWSTSIDWASIEGAEHQIVATNGLLLPDEAREQGRQLLLGHVRDGGGSGTIGTGTTKIAYTGSIVDYTVLNAGTYERDTADTFTAARLARQVDLNLIGTAHCLEAIMPAMIAARSGQIGLVSSLAGLAGLPGSASYSATKAGLIALAESLRFDLRQHGVGISAICPGFVKSPLTAKNTFPMPFLMEADAAAKAIMRGLEADRFLIAFPEGLARPLRILRSLPYGVFFPLIVRGTRG
jgi:NAD(P)-dependent dehydrogenase (short-subunit alcohol dehydrogenase family)